MQVVSYMKAKSRDKTGEIKMEFIQVGDEFFNQFAIGRLFTEDVVVEEDTITKYFAEMIGGQVIEITQTQFDELVGA